MSGRKRTKRKNSDEDFDLDEADDGLDIDEINKWACHSCTFVNRAAAFRCFVCGTRKGTSTRRSRCNDNVVEMQKSITDMVQKQVEKEKSLKRKERSVVKSVPRDSVEPLADIKTEGTFVEEPKTKTSETSVAQTSIISHLSTPMATIKSESNDETMMKPPALKTPKEKKTYNKKTAKASRESTPYKNGTPTHLGTVQQKLSRESTPHMNGIPYQGLEHSTVQPALLENKVLPLPPAPSTSHIAGLPLNFIPKISDVKMEITPDPQPVQHFVSAPSTSTYYPQATTTVASQVSKTLTPENARPMKPTDDNIFHHLPERIVKKLNQQLPYDYDLLKAHKRITGIDPIVAESEAVLLPHDWDRQKVMKGLASSLGSSHNVSPTTSRQSSETDSSSSDGNRSFETPFHDAPSSVSKSCQIPDYMIHRDAPRKIFIVSNGFPAFFEEFPRRI